MKLLNECGIRSKYLPGQSYSCIVQAKDMCYALVTGGRKLICCKENHIDTIELSRSYIKVTAGTDDETFYGYTLIGPKNEIDVYRLDAYFLEADYFSVRQEGIGRLEDFWIDSGRRFLFLVHSGSIEKFNLNADYLERFMKAPSGTRYLAMCSSAETVYLAYERESCIHIAEYSYDGSYNHQYILGNGYQIKSMEPTGDEVEVFAVKKGGICVILTLTCNTEEKKEPLCLEVIRGDGIGEITCSIKQQHACHK